MLKPDSLHPVVYHQGGFLPLMFEAVTGDDGGDDDAVDER
jgi:hypothetical protein